MALACVQLFGNTRGTYKADTYKAAVGERFARLSHGDNGNLRRGQLHSKVRLRVLRLFRDGILRFGCLLCGREGKGTFPADSDIAAGGFRRHRPRLPPLPSDVAAV